MTALVARLSAAMAALVVLLGLVATPPKAPEAAAIATISIADVQLDAAAAATPTINDIIELAALIAATPLWYAALPITLPASIALGVGFSLVLNIIRGNYSADLVLSAVVGAGVFLVGPPLLISSKLSAFLPSAAAPAPAQPLQTAAVPSLQALADVVKAVAAAAFSYATLPITLPAAVVTAAWKELYTNVVGGNPHFDIGAAVLRAVTTLISAPLDAIYQSVSTLFQPSTPVAAQAQSATTDPVARQSATAAQRSVASSGRAALAAIRTHATPAADLSGTGSASAHRAVPRSDAETAGTPARKTATGGSGRGVRKSQAD
ncbi:hypothetical protein MANY_48750 [Mycolicibacterium anyangense]|uniref:Uncharacterized protein n=1 Tax=Mycolicibacterium anyangense TaxID=1431246 RepID=A0A6N4WG68_9MYCO|nr:hypothetical protein [Mycolicibacterium anyangense]BBZ79538.1 hypothetical protein MANY_48750 [Mycolicibacterium anyangense]